MEPAFERASAGDHALRLRSLARRFAHVLGRHARSSRSRCQVAPERATACRPSGRSALPPLTLASGEWSGASDSAGFTARRVRIIGRTPDAQRIAEALIVLELGVPFSDVEVERARRRLAKQWHPDRATNTQQRRGNEMHMKDVNSCADELAELARRSGGRVTDIERPAQMPTPDASESPPERGEAQPRPQTGPQRPTAPLYAWCSIYPEWGVGRLIWLTRLKSGRQVAQLRFENGVNTVPFESLEFVNFSRTKNPEEWAQRFIRAARDALGAGDTQRAQQLLGYARSFRPGNSGLLRLSMLAALRAEDFARASSFLEQWRRAEGDRPSVNRYASIISERLGSKREAGEWVRRAARATNAPEDWMRAARLFIAAEALADAAEAIERILQTHDEPEWRLQAADVDRMRGRPEAELRHLRAMLELHPDSVAGIARLVEALVRSGATAQAMQHCREAAQRLESPLLSALLSDLRDNRADTGPSAANERPSKAGRSAPSPRRRMTEEGTHTAPRILDGQYALPTAYREGGMARVYRATDLHSDNKVVAVKLLKTTTGDIALANLSAQRECDALFRLRHPNIVSILDAGRDGNQRYLVFEWFDQSLSDALRDSGPLAWTDFFSRWGRPILEGLAHAHARRVAHRDIKPANILLSNEAAPLIADFGIAKLTHEVALGRTMVDHRSPPYAPPEYDSGPHTLTRDVYAFAVMAALIVAGIDPYADEFNHPDEAVPLALSAADLPDEVRDYLQRCLAAPDERPIDASVALSEIDHLEAERAAMFQEPGPRIAHELPVVLTNKALRELAIDFGASEDVAAEVLVEEEFSGRWHAAPLPSFDDASSAGHYHLLGGELRLHALVDERGDRLLAVGARRIGDARLGRDREHAWPASGFVVELGNPRNSAAGAAAIHMFEEGIGLHESGANRSAPSGGSRLLDMWRNTLRALRSLEKSRQQPLSYKAVRATPAGATFTLIDAPPVNIAGTTRVCELMERGFLRGEVVGVKGNEITLRIVDGDVTQVPPRGTLRVDTALEAMAISRQYDALDAVEAGEAVRTDLLDLVTRPDGARPPDDIGDLDWRQPDLDDDKRRATGSALGTRDLLHVEGPPGTGKTKFITETILQAIRRDPSKRLLLSSQTHAALDNVIERLIEMDSDIRIVRIGREDDPRVSDDARPYLVRPVLARWRKQVEKKGRGYLRDWARERGMSPRDVEIAALHEEVAFARRQQIDAGFELAALEDEIEAARERQRQQPTTDQTHGIGILQDQRRALEVTAADAAVRADRALDRLTKLGAIGSAGDLDGLSPEAIEAIAEQLVPPDTPEVDRCKGLISLLGEWHATFGHGPQFEAAALMRAQVVAATCVGLAGVRGVESIDFDLCIIDEASKATATELLIPMSRARRWVLVGDSRQLPPFLDSDLDRSLLAEHGLTDEEVRETLFADLAERLPAPNRVMLSRQYRMVPEIGDLISTCFYEGRLESAARQEQRWLCNAVGGKPVVWLTTSRDRHRRESGSGTSYVNPVEASAVRAILGRINLAAAGHERLEVAVISGYLAQVQEIELAIAASLSKWDAIHVEVATVNSFQGREADVVIYSVVRSNPERKIGFLREPPLLNVALSRGRELLVIIGDHQFVRSARGKNSFSPVLRYVDEHPADCVMQAAP